jgi:HlyD family secretion protein
MGGAASKQQQVLVQAPGWIEADPYAISVPVLTSGVVREVLVLEGQRVEKDQVVARLVDEDAKLSVQRLSAELEAMKLEVEKARADCEAAMARAAEVKDEVTRKGALVEAGGISEGQLARLKLRLRGMDQEVASAQAAIRAAEAKVRQQEVMLEEAELMLSRTEVRSPGAGVVLARLVEPGARVSMEGAMAGAVVRLYDPTKLQVRVDVPISEAAKVGVGTEAQVVTEALPDTVFKGKVTRLVHEANIQRNTVQVKVAIDNPSETLKPEMLTRVRFVGSAGAAGAAAHPGHTPGMVMPETEGGKFLIPAAALMHAQGGSAHVMIVSKSQEAGSVASMRAVTYTPSSHEGYAEVAGALREGDRVIVEPLDRVQDGSRVNVAGEWKEGANGAH